MAAYARYPASALPKEVGVDDASGRRKSDGREGHLCYGPYVSLGPGQYTAGFYLRRGPLEGEGHIVIEACAQHGKRVFARRSTPVKNLFASVDGLVHLDFEVAALEQACELRLHVPSQVRVEVTEAVIFRRDLASWGHR